ncbi:MAG: hypothetical protein EF813_00295 [Methanosarcinales archaeon]|nr:MAG: hypothetical protein EF813_00295 [Methanosarcinales archaeon]
MYIFTDKISELSNLIRKFNIYYALLDSILIFMAAYATVIFTGVHTVCAGKIPVDIITFSDIGAEITMPALCALMLAVLITITVSALNVLRAQRRGADADTRVCTTIGTVYHDLSEPLKTAHDNSGVENVVVADLADGVAKKMDEIEYSSFLDQKRMTGRVIAIIMLALVIISLAVADFSVVNSVGEVRLPVLGTIGGTGDAAGDGEDAEPIEIGDGGSRDNIYGDPTVAAIEGTNLDLTMYTGIGSEFSIRETNNGVKQEFETSSPFPVEPVAAGAPEPERISDADLVGRYFEELATT